MTREPLLIISYYYPPCNLAAANRAYAWVKYLPKLGYEPIVITRNWDIPIRTRLDVRRPTGAGERHEKLAIGEIFYLPFIGTYHDRILYRHGMYGKVLARKLALVSSVMSEHIFGIPTLNRDFLSKAREVLNTRPDIKKMVVTADPFGVFAVAHRLARMYPDLRWIADYRDDWTTSTLRKRLRTQHATKTKKAYVKACQCLEKRSEIKWTSTASCITSVSDTLTTRIGLFLRKPSYTIPNGFLEEDYENLKIETNTSQFILSYTGILYSQQPIELLLSAFKQLYEKYRARISLQFRFIGTGYDARSKNRILAELDMEESAIVITERLPHKIVLEREAEADVLVAWPYGSDKGIPGSKLYQYIGHKKPIMLCPSDNDIIERTVIKAGAGIVCNTEQEAIDAMSRLIDKKIEVGAVPTNKTDIMAWSRRASTERLAELLVTL